MRLSAPLLHAGAALALGRAAIRLYSPSVGFWTALLYAAIPGVQLSSVVVSTDAPLLLCLALAVWAYAVIWTSDDARQRRWAAWGLGAALGAAFLTKYAALYIAGGLILCSALSADARRRWDGPTLRRTVVMAAIVAAPNLVWNATHHFQTIAHTAENADLGNGDRGWRGLFGARGPFGYIIGQFVVFGPIPFGVLLVGAWRAWRRDPHPTDRMLLALAAPALLIVFVESIISRANANWAGAGYAPGVILVAAWIDRWQFVRGRTAALATQTAFALIFVVAVLNPGLTDRLGAGSAFKRARGWAAAAAAVQDQARNGEVGPGLTAVAADDRFLFNALAYYGRSPDGTPAGAFPAPLRMWVHLDRPANQAETESPLDASHGSRALVVSVNTDYQSVLKSDFNGLKPAGRIFVKLTPRQERRLDLFVGEGFSPRPRALVSDLPRAH